MLWQSGESVRRAAAADLDAHLAGPPTAGPLSVAKIDLLDWWSRELVVVDQVTAIASPVASLAFMTVPAGAVILSVQANLETDISHSGSAVKVGIGPSGSLNKYGQTAGLAKNMKINRIPAWAVLAAAETEMFSALQTNNNQSGTIGPGRIRTLVAYMALTSLPDAP